MIYLFQPYVPQEAIEQVSAVLRSRWIGQGPKVDQFEREFGEKFGKRYCVAVNSGSAALETAYELVGIQAYDEVICTPLTCTATNIPLLRMGAKIVWADIRWDSLCMDREDVLRKITPRTKAIVNVHLGGIENDLGPMPVPVIADAAQALGIFSGDLTCCSFQAIKHITTGDGGMLVVRDAGEERHAKLLRWFGIDREAKHSYDEQPHQGREMTYDLEVLGYKRQPTDIDAALGLAGLCHYDEVIAKRSSLFAHYKRLLRVPVIDGPRNVYWLCTVLLHNRDLIARKLWEHEIETNVVQVRNDAYRIFGGRVKLPVMDQVEDHYLSLPLHMGIAPDDVWRICEIVNRYESE